MPQQHRSTNAATAALTIAGALAVTALAVNIAAERAERLYPPQGRFITINGARLHFMERRGTGDALRPLVFIHGNGAMLEEAQISGLLDRVGLQRRLVVIDRPGFGHSERPRGSQWPPDEQADLMWKALRRLGVENPILIGHSWGCMVAVAMALKQPNRVAGLVLMSGYYFPETQPGILLAAGPALPVIGPIMRNTISPVLGLMLAPHIIRKTFAPAPVPDRFSDYPVSLALRPSQLRASAEDSATMIEAARAMSRRYHHLTMPILIIADPEDHIVRQKKQSLRLHRLLPHSELAAIRGAGHMLHHIATRRVAEKIERFLDEVEGVGAEADEEFAAAEPTPAQEENQSI